MSASVAIASAHRRDLAVSAGLLVAIVLLVAGGNLAGNGVFGPVEVSPGAALPGWEQGSLLRVLCLWVANWFRAILDAETALVLVYIALATGAATAIYASLRTSNWPALPAMMILILVAGHGVLLFSVTMARQEFLLVLAVALLIPASRRLESVGDVQAIINYGLTLPLLLLAGPPLAVLIPLLVLAVPFREAESRQRPSVFAAMLLVAVVPVLIIVAGVWAMAARAGIGVDMLVAPFAAAFVRDNSALVGPLVVMLMTAPVGLIMLLHIIVPDRRRQIVTTLLALGLPIYVAVGNSLFAWQLASWTPTVIMLAATLGWLSATRLRAWMQVMTIILLAAGLLASWLMANAWAEPAWLAGLLPLRVFGYSLGLPVLG